jgi:hypothetical protein
MIHIVIFGIGFLMMIFSILSGFIVVYNKENKFPRWMTINWVAILMMYSVLVGLGYFGYLLYPHLVNILDWLKGLHL